MVEQSRLIQLLDWEGMEFGLIRTTATDEQIQFRFTAYMRGGLDDLSDEHKQSIGYQEDLSADGFAEYLMMEGYKTQRVFIDSEIVP